MEGAKSAMYAQAGRNRGWSTVNTTSGDMSAPMQPAAAISIPEPIPMPEIIPAPVMVPQPVVIPEPYTSMMPEVFNSKENCQTLAMAFVKMQDWQGLYEPEQGFSCGTIFAELDLPWLPEGECNYE